MTVSQPSLANPGAPVPAQKQRTNVYTVMLIIAFIFIVTSCVLLYMELKRWGNYPWWNTTEATPRAAWVSQPPTPGSIQATDLA